MRPPQSVRVDLSPEAVAEALRVLEVYWMLPNGDEVIDANSLRSYRTQLQRRYYYHLVLSPDDTKEEILEWARTHGREVRTGRM